MTSQLTPEQIAELRAEVSNPATGSLHHLRKLSLLLLDELEAAEKRNTELRQQLANAEYQLHMAELAKYNLKASRKAQFRKRRAAEKRIAELSASHSKLHEGMAAIYNAICADGASTSLSAILTFVKRAFEESKGAAGITLQDGE